MFGLGKKRKAGKKEEKRKTQEKLREKEEKELQRDLSLIDDRILEEIPYRLSGDTRALKTGIDSLYSLVKDSKNISSAKAARKLGVSEEMVSEWANIMEEHEMLRIHYPIFGKPSLRSMDWRPRWKVKREMKKKKEHEKAVGKRLRHLKFTKKRLFIFAETIVLGEILIYIFLVNRKLSTNFLPVVIERLSFFYLYLTQNLMMLILVLAFIGFTVFMMLGRRSLGKKKKAGK
jgi:hypothetical protein